MTWIVILTSTWAYEIIASAGLVRLIPAQWLPNIALLWIYILADRTPQTAARATDVWLSGLALSTALGYMVDVFEVAPRGLHASLYAITFVAVRIATDRLSQAHPLRFLLQIGLATFAAQAAVWYTKALTQGFSTLALQPWGFVTHALVTASLGLLLFPLMNRLFDDEQQERL